MQPTEPPKINLHQLLRAMVEKGASDLHIATGSPPQLRIDGSLVPLKTPPLSPIDTKQLCYSVLTEEQTGLILGNTPLGRPGQPVEVAPIYVLLASDEGSYITGQRFGVTGGKPIL